MYKIKKGGLFNVQLFELAENYKGTADLETADRFLDCVDEAVEFIAHRPLACAIYYEAAEIVELRKHEYRKWRVKTFPFLIFFRIIDSDIVLLEAIYAHKMNMIKRMSSEIEVSSDR